MIKLRPRQIKLKNDIRKACREGFKKILCQAPPGFGKTPTMASIIKDIVSGGRNVLFLVHRKELLEQCSLTLEKLEVYNSILVNKHPKLNLSLPVQLSSWQTMKSFIKGGEISVFNPDVILYDEAHRSVADVALNILNCFPQSFLFGFTGTPYRDDGKGLGDLYQTLIETCSTNTLISEGLIIKPFYHQCSNLKDVTSYIKQDDDEEINPEIADLIIRADVVRNFKKICPDSQGVIFCSNTDQAELTAEKFRKGGFSANMVECNSKNRKQILTDFANKKFQILTNASLLSEGWDYPPLTTVVFLRNIQSRVFFRQAANRCMRIAPNKQTAHILDFFNCWERFEGLPWDDEYYSLDPTTNINKKEKSSKEKLNIPVSCRECNTVNESTDSNCICCGAPLNFKMERIVVEAVNDLVTIDEDYIKASKEEKQKEFNKLCAICMNKGFKWGWVNNKYKEKFGVWPKGLAIPLEFEKYKNEGKIHDQQRKLQFN
jgi:superfamily II DNA or RNA helicase